MGFEPTTPSKIAVLGVVGHNLGVWVAKVANSKGSPPQIPFGDP